MERIYRYLFTLCLIIGYQIHMPVTMFPANVVDGGTPILLVKGFDTAGHSENVIGPITDTGIIAGYTGQQINPEIQDPTNSIRHKNAHVREYFIPASHVEGLDKHEKVIASQLEEHVNLNTVANQAQQTDLHEFNTRNGLNGLEATMGAKNIKSDKSVLSRIPLDLTLDIKLGQMQDRLDNISSNLSMKKNIVPTNNRLSSKHNKHVLDKENTVNNLDRVDINFKSKSPDRIASSKGKGNKYHNTNSLNTDNTINIYVNGIVWSNDFIDGCPQRLSIEENTLWRQQIQNNDIIKIEEGCGSMQNRLITFNNSVKACARYRANTDQMQGDIYSVYLAKLLGMQQYIPPTTLYKVSNSAQWKPVHTSVVESKWSENQPIILTKWIDNLDAVYIPPELKDDKRRLHPENYRFEGRSTGELCELVQWSDLIVFDYISANLDRVVNNMFNLKWNYKMMDKPIHNLEKSTVTGSFMFLDNESGLFHGYRLLDTYGLYHESLLQAVCVFRKSTVDAVETLYKREKTGEMLQSLYENNEQYHGFLPRIPVKNRNILGKRVEHVYKHIQLCKHQYPEGINYR